MNLQIFAGLFLFGLGLEDALGFLKQAEGRQVERWSRNPSLVLFFKSVTKLILGGILVSNGLKVLQFHGFSV